MSVRRNRFSIHADEIIPVSGDSMEPLYSDRQEVYVQHCAELRPGEIGIFLLDGDAYCKMLSQEDGVSLVSLNSAYRPIPIGEFSELRILGKVVA